MKTPLEIDQILDKESDEFVQAYKNCAAWLVTTLDDDDSYTSAKWDMHLRDRGIKGDTDSSDEILEEVLRYCTPQTHDQMRQDCINFLRDNIPVLLIATAKSEYTMTQAGHDFFLTRNHHGAGFWDSPLDEPFGRVLTESAHLYGEFSLQLYIDDKTGDWVCEG